MALTVETGSGSATADAFVSVADCDTYCEARGLTDWTGAADSPADVKEAAIRRATAELSSAYAWKGTRTKGRLQALAWPRTSASDGEGNDIATDEVPVEIVEACCELASREVASPGYASPDVVLTDRVRRENVGSLETEYAATPNAPEASRPTMFRVLQLIGGFLNSSGNGIVGRAARG